MGIWFVDPEVGPGEQCLHRATVNQLLDLGRAVGGKLVVTDQRVLFEPNRLDRLTGGRGWAMNLREIQQVVIEPGGKQGVARYGPAGARPQVVMTTGSGESTVFVVRDRDGLVAAVAGARMGGVGGTT